MYVHVYYIVTIAQLKATYTVKFYNCAVSLMVVSVSEDNRTFFAPNKESP